MACVILTLTAGTLGCDSNPDDKTTEGAADDTGTTTGDGDGESGTSGNSGDGDGDPSETDPDCPLGSFDCPCDDGMCAAGLTCGADDLCSLGGGTGDPSTGDPTGDPTGNPSTTGGTAEPYDPEACEAPSEILSVEKIAGDFCSAPCVDSEECPSGPPGTTPACAIATEGAVPNFCALICTPESEDCPAGSTCKVIPQQPNTGLCTYP
ncbi:hypothetical protein DB30_03899 [Enhygromyxa salina]|uniref:Uncharacterized protein n=1 Tax=Enhygromyxa salina TaxID=215803 RepID=A0A0C2A7A3_9BACT|nr:hypothetical protein DB30_03899 [Enhygromyxa salina]